MAKVLKRIGIEFTATLVLNEDEIGALDALVGYGTKPFLEAFYEKMGRAYMEPHEAGLISLFEAIRTQVNPAISQIADARKAIEAM
jgi:hypothetical protein